jgi:hypothetical protein
MLKPLEETIWEMPQNIGIGNKLLEKIPKA